MHSIGFKMPELSSKASFSERVLSLMSQDLKVGSKFYTTFKIGTNTISVTHDFEQYLIAQGFQIEIKNCAPRGGQIGKYIEIVPNN